MYSTNTYGTTQIHTLMYKLNTKERERERVVSFVLLSRRRFFFLVREEEEEEGDEEEDATPIPKKRYDYGEEKRTTGALIDDDFWRRIGTTSNRCLLMGMRRRERSDWTGRCSARTKP